jgi:tetratricopeptide (TPR) repeat protein
MAGAGKTACALELAYRHEHGRFDGMAWYRAPLEDHDIGTALADFAIALETQLAGFAFVHIVDDADRLERFLPRLTRLLHDRSVLVVVDNIESLLTSQGTWRDARWGMVIDAMLAHDGLSRLVLTSRLAPERLARSPAVLVEHVGSLSPDESLLLARQLPQLGGLIEGRSMQDAVEARELARQTLETVQGNPKLIEFADHQARTPAALRDRLAEARAAWGQRAERLQTFFDTGEVDEDAVGFLRVMRSWTLKASERLPEKARIAFHFLCAVEQGDRRWQVLAQPWAAVWHALGNDGDGPPLEAALEMAADQGLLEAERRDDADSTRYYVHPAIEQAGRDGAPEGFQKTVDQELCSFWIVQFRRAADGPAPEIGQMLVRAGLAAAPYALRLGREDDAQTLLEDVIARDQSGPTLAAVLPLLDQLAERAAGTPREMKTRVLLLQARGCRDPHAVLPELRELLAQAQRAGDVSVADWIAGMLVGLLRETGGLREALSIIDGMTTLTRLSGKGPWTQASNEVMRLQVMHAMGEPPRRILAEAIQLEEQIAELEQAPEGGRPERVSHWEVREALLDVAQQAALELMQYEYALAVGQEIVESKRRRGAPLLQQAEAAFNVHVPLVRLERYDDADELLRSCRSIFEQEGALQHIALVLSGCADLEHSRGRFDAAIDFERRSLRLRYAIKDPELALISHTNLASYLLLKGGDDEGVRDHRLAAATLAYEIRSGRQTETIRGLSSALATTDAGMSFDELCAALGDEIDLAGLLASLPDPAASTSEALQAVIEQALAFDEFEHMRGMWDPIHDLAVAAAAGDADAARQLEEFLEAFLEEVPKCTGLATAIRGVVAGERDASALCAGLPDAEATIVRDLLDRL